MIALRPSLSSPAENLDGVALPELDVEAANPSPDSSFENKVNTFNQVRDSLLLPKFAATSYTLDRTAIEALPQGSDTPIDKVLLQTPSVSSDSAISNPDFHIRNEYSNVQYRINGILLPEGVSGFGQVLETNFVGSLNLLDGVLPAQYGLRTAGVIDITTPSLFASGGNVSFNSGGRATISPSFDYGASDANTQYFVTGRYFQSREGLENPLPSLNPIHDQTYQGKFFAYLSTLLGESNRLTVMTGASINQFQIPNVTGLQAIGNLASPSLNSANLNENQYESYVFNIIALQSSFEKFDTQLAFFSRYATAHFVPDAYSDLVFNNVASNVSRESFLNGIQFDGATTLNETNVLRAGFGVTAEQTKVQNISTVLPLDADGNPVPTPITLIDDNTKLGWNLGGYLQDEWKISDKLTLNTGLRFDQLYQFVAANQFSPRIALVYKLWDDTTFHAGYSRYFTPPTQADAAPTNISLFNNTTQQAAIPLENPVRPERSHYFDIGFDQKPLPGVSLGGDLFYKIATDLLDDGQFGQAVVLSQLNFARGYSEGIEFKAKYQKDGLTAYANLSSIRTKAIDLVSNQYLIDDPAEFAYLANNYHFTDDAQLITASAGLSYRWQDTLISTDAIFGSGLRSGFANLDHVQPYAQINLGISHAFDLANDHKPLTLGFNVINLLDTTYLLRDGMGIGEFAPQYGPRRGFFISISQKL